MRLTLVTLAALLLASPALADRPIVGINDDALRAHYAEAAPTLDALHPDQVGVWTTPSDVSTWTIPADVGVLLQLVGSPWDFDHPEAFAGQARRLVLQHPNVRELQVWNEPDLCWVPCAPYPSDVDGVSQNRFYGSWMNRYLDLLAATHRALVGTGVQTLGFGMSPRMGAKWSPEAVALGIERWRNLTGGRRLVQTVGGGDPSGEWHSREWRGVAYAGPLMDGFAYHPYVLWGDEFASRVWNALHVPLYWTETGMDVLEPAGSSGYFGSVVWIYGAEGTEQDQAARLANVLDAAKRNEHVAAVFNFLLTDEPDLARWQSGLLRPDGSRKAAFATFAGR